MSLHSSSKKYWDSYYLSSRPLPPSQFCVFLINELQDYEINTIFDLGCGDLRDTNFFVASNFSVVSVDQSTLIKLSNSTNLFIHGNILEDSIWKDIRIHKKINSLFYARFLLHCFSKEDCKTFFSQINKNSEIGDFVALEYRTVKDKKLPKATPQHLRFYHSNEYVNSLIEEFEIIYDFSSRGLAKYKNDDAFVRRLVMRKK